MAAPAVPTWSAAILHGVGAPVTPANLTALHAWTQAEGGTAANNPFNTTQPAAGATSYNPIGVRNYLTPQQGIQATVQTLTNGRYGNVLNALRQGTSAVQVGQAIAQSPWGTGSGVLRVLGAPTTAAPSVPAQPATAAPVTPQTPSNPLANPIVQQVLSSNDRLLGIAPPTFPTPATAPTRTTAGSTGQLTYKIQGHSTARTQQAIQDAEDYLGTPYVYGGESTKGFDCSGLLQYVWAKNGVSIPRTTYQQFQTGTPVAKTNLQPGDAVFFTGSDPKNGLPGHVAMYIGAGKVIQAPHTGADVEVTNLSAIPGYQGARRYAA